MKKVLLMAGYGVFIFSFCALPLNSCVHIADAPTITVFPELSEFLRLRLSMSGDRHNSLEDLVISMVQRVAES